MSNGGVGNIPKPRHEAIGNLAAIKQKRLGNTIIISMLSYPVIFSKLLPQAFVLYNRYQNVGL
jgi:hypothetical protein